MGTYIYHLSFKGPVHFGLEGIGLEAVEDRLPSDSLTSAVINATAILEGAEGANRMVSALASQSPPFVLSSLFPYGPDPKEPGKIIEALVRPMNDPPVRKTGILRDVGKDLKPIRYLRPEDFQMWMGNGLLAEEGIEGIIKRSKDLTKDWWKKDLRPRVALDRQSQNSSLWSQAGIWFVKERENSENGTVRAEAGLYGLVRFFHESWKSRLEAAFQILGDTGLGGERTYGMGLFNFSGFEDPPQHWQEILTDNDSSRQVLFSLYYPAEPERETLKEALDVWDFIERRGFIVSGRNATSLKRKHLRMIIEGSVSRSSLKGCMADVTPDNHESLGLAHRIYRSGLAFLLPERGGT